MHDRTRDWSERGTRPRGDGEEKIAAAPLARSSLSITVDEKRKYLRAVYKHPYTR